MAERTLPRTRTQVAGGVCYAWLDASVGGPSGCIVVRVTLSASLSLVSKTPAFLWDSCTEPRGLIQSSPFTDGEDSSASPGSTTLVAPSFAFFFLGGGDAAAAFFVVVFVFAFGSAASSRDGGGPSGGGFAGPVPPPALSSTCE
eukprot:CAMPEP_0113578574 /NCGR_PEP_ID=MMETSP0015_2-20120614/29565_1 /TAXON_ID=2838 /ORGANISM="Odontella" /LENGTH=143 /DNA_ID=CAMNT_0000482411 /DNA_START=407 /DNA_END=838 /DNA_ORIENTATION=- /assembly_acc=CAM_ASM_000160